MGKTTQRKTGVPNVTTVRLTEDQTEYLEAKKQMGVSQSFTIRQALDVWIASDNRGSKRKEKSRCLVQK